MNPAIESAKSEFLSLKARLERVFAATPDDRLNWSPASTARTPVQLVAHAALALKGIHGSLAGEPLNIPSSAEFDAMMCKAEEKFSTREEVVGLYETASADFVAWLESVTDDQLKGVWHSPFGDVPMAEAIHIPAQHTTGHVSQLDYVQTCYGDRVWH